jgi:hypothetical protein
MAIIRERRRVERTARAAELLAVMAVLIGTAAALLIRRGQR